VSTSKTRPGPLYFASYYDQFTIIKTAVSVVLSPAACRVVLFAMQTAVLSRPFPSVRHSVTFRYRVQRNEDTIMWFSASGSTILLVSKEVKFIFIFAGDHPSKGVKVKHPLSLAKI